jgi:hypothetical protein
VSAGLGLRCVTVAVEKRAGGGSRGSSLAYAAGSLLQLYDMAMLATLMACSKVAKETLWPHVVLSRTLHVDLCQVATAVA